MRTEGLLKDMGSGAIVNGDAAMSSGVVFDVS